MADKAPRDAKKVPISLPVKTDNIRMILLGLEIGLQ